MVAFLAGTGVAGTGPPALFIVDPRAQERSTGGRASPTFTWANLDVHTNTRPGTPDQCRRVASGNSLVEVGGSRFGGAAIPVRRSARPPGSRRGGRPPLPPAVAPVDSAESSGPAQANIDLAIRASRAARPVRGAQPRTVPVEGAPAIVNPGLS